MSIGAQHVLQVSELARIKVERAEIASLAEKLTEIIIFVDRLKEIDTENIEPLFNPLDAVQKLRADVISESDESATLLEIAPLVDENLFIVPKVIG